MMKRLFASIHDVSPRFEGEVDQLLDHLAPHVGRRLAMLVVPDHWSSAPITPPFARRLRGWADEGIEILREITTYCATGVRGSRLTHTPAPPPPPPPAPASPGDADAAPP